MKLICVCWKTSRNAKASPARGGGIERSEDDGEVVQSSTCVIPLTLKASFVQPLSLASARQLPWQGSPWQRGFVFDETDLRLPENVTECQSLPYEERLPRPGEVARKCRKGTVASSEAKMTERFCNVSGKSRKRIKFQKLPPTQPVQSYLFIRPASVLHGLADTNL